jgi:hypothetical protein
VIRWRARARGTTEAIAPAGSAGSRPAQRRPGASSPAVVVLLALDFLVALSLVALSLVAFVLVAFVLVAGPALVVLVGLARRLAQAREGFGKGVGQVAEDVGRVVELDDGVRAVELAPGAGLGLVLGDDFGRERAGGLEGEALVVVVDDDEITQD